MNCNNIYRASKGLKKKFCATSVYRQGCPKSCGGCDVTKSCAFLNKHSKLMRELLCASTDSRCGADRKGRPGYWCDVNYAKECPLTCGTCKTAAAVEAKALEEASYQQFLDKLAQTGTCADFSTGANGVIIKYNGQFTCAQMTNSKVSTGHPYALANPTAALRAERARRACATRGGVWGQGVDGNARRYCRKTCGTCTANDFDPAKRAIAKQKCEPRHAASVTAFACTGNASRTRCLLRAPLDARAAATAAAALSASYCRCTVCKSH